MCMCAGSRKKDAGFWWAVASKHWKQLTCHSQGNCDVCICLCITKSMFYQLFACNQIFLFIIVIVEYWFTVEKSIVMFQKLWYSFEWSYLVTTLYKMRYKRLNSFLQISIIRYNDGPYFNRSKSCIFKSIYSKYHTLRDTHLYKFFTIYLGVNVLKRKTCINLEMLLFQASNHVSSLFYKISNVILKYHIHFD